MSMTKMNVERELLIDAPLTAVRPLIADFSQWLRWSPWTLLEPDCDVAVSGLAGDVGHSMSWEGRIIGAGRNTLVAQTDTELSYQLEFMKPWKSQANVYFNLEALGNQTKVRWRMASSWPIFLFFMKKTMTNLVDMDYQRGLSMLKRIAEQGALSCETLNQGVVPYQGFSYVGVQRTVAFADMPSAMQKDFERLTHDIVQVANKGAQHWVSLYPSFNMKTMMVTYIAACSDEDLYSVALPADYVRGQIASGSSLEIKHNGDYAFLGNAWAMGNMHTRSLKLKTRGAPFEQYWNNPADTP